MPLTYTFDPMDIDQNERLAASMNNVWLVMSQAKQPCFASAHAQAALNICSLLDGLARETVAVGAGYETLPGGNPGTVKAQNETLHGATAALVNANVPKPKAPPTDDEPRNDGTTTVTEQFKAKAEAGKSQGEDDAETKPAPILQAAE